jgi:hypothetical protein
LLTGGNLIAGGVADGITSSALNSTFHGKTPDPVDMGLSGVLNGATAGLASKVTKVVNMPFVTHSTGAAGESIIRTLKGVPNSAKKAIWTPMGLRFPDVRVPAENLLIESKNAVLKLDDKLKKQLIKDGWINKNLPNIKTELHYNVAKNWFNNAGKTKVVNFIQDNNLNIVLKPYLPFLSAAEQLAIGFGHLSTQFGIEGDK